MVVINTYPKMKKKKLKRNKTSYAAKTDIVLDLRIEIYKLFSN